MLGGGSVQNMIDVLRNNKKLLRRKNMFKKEHTFLSLKQDYLKVSGGRIKFQKSFKRRIVENSKKTIESPTTGTYFVCFPFVCCGWCFFLLHLKINTTAQFCFKKSAIVGF